MSIPQAPEVVVDRLEELRLVERLPDPADRGVKQIAVTERGREVGEAIHQALFQSAELQGRLDDDELVTLLRWWETTSRRVARS